MKTSIIRVYNSRYNEWAPGVRVCLQFTDFASMGFTKEVNTDANGNAYIDHNGSGNANIFANGEKVGNLYAPDSVTVHI